jgi:hypothetical protein
MNVNHHGADAQQRCDAISTLRRVMLVLLILLAAVPMSGVRDQAMADEEDQPDTGPAAPVCATSGPEDLSYIVELCLTAPGANATLEGRMPVEATLAVASETAPPARFLQFFLTESERDGSVSLLRDYVSPFTFTLPTERWTDGSYRLTVAATFTDGFVTPETALSVSLSNGVARRPVSTGRWEPVQVTGTGNEPVIVAAVGDGAGGLPGAEDVAELIAGWNPDMFLYLGDIYNSGTYTEFLNYYYPTFGRFDTITNPVPGDHEGGRQFQGYLDYWNSSQHFYTTTAGAWRLIALNSTSRYGQVTSGTYQFQWLENQLSADRDNGCTMVFFHEPRWSISSPEEKEYLDELWGLLVREGVDLVVTGHEHRYERWKPLDESGTPSVGAPVEFVVGTGGHELNPSRRTLPEVDSVYTGDGALRLELRAGAADFQFISTAGKTIDSGTIRCHIDEPIGIGIGAAAVPGLTAEDGRTATSAMLLPGGTPRSFVADLPRPPVPVRISRIASCSAVRLRNRRLSKREDTRSSRIRGATAPAGWHAIRMRWCSRW